MLWLAILIAIFLLVVAYLLFAPLYVEVDSRRGLFRVRFHWLAGARVFLKDSLYVEINITWWHKTFDLLALQKGKRKEKGKVKGKVKEKKISLEKIKAVIQTFKVKKLELNIDTGDNYLNGILFPWLLLAALRTRRNIEVNFTGENNIVFEIKNNVARMLWAFFKS